MNCEPAKTDFFESLKDSSILTGDDPKYWGAMNLVLDKITYDEGYIFQFIEKNGKLGEQKDKTGNIFISLRNIPDIAKMEDASLYYFFIRTLENLAENKKFLNRFSPRKIYIINPKPNLFLFSYYKKKHEVFDDYIKHLKLEKDRIKQMDEINEMLDKPLESGLDYLIFEWKERGINQKIKEKLPLIEESIGNEENSGFAKKMGFTKFLRELRNQNGNCTDHADLFGISSIYCYLIEDRVITAQKEFRRYCAILKQRAAESKRMMDDFSGIQNKNISDVIRGLLKNNLGEMGIGGFDELRRILSTIKDPYSIICP